MLNRIPSYDRLNIQQEVFMLVESLASRWYFGEGQYGCHCAFGVVLPLSYPFWVVLLSHLVVLGSIALSHPPCMYLSNRHGHVGCIHMWRKAPPPKRGEEGKHHHTNGGGGGGGGKQHHPQEETNTAPPERTIGKYRRPLVLPSPTPFGWCCFLLPQPFGCWCISLTSSLLLLLGGTDFPPRPFMFLSNTSRYSRCFSFK